MALLKRIQLNGGSAILKETRAPERNSSGELVTVGAYELYIDRNVESIVGGFGLTGEELHDELVKIYGDITVTGGSYRLKSLRSLFERTKQRSILFRDFISDNVENTDLMFHLSSIESLDLSGLNLPNLRQAVNMFSMIKTNTLNFDFIKCPELNNIDCMFRNMEVTELELSGYEDSRVVNTGLSFGNITVHKLILKDFKFGSELGDEEKVLGSFNLFKCKELHIKNWDVSKEFIEKHLDEIFYGGFTLDASEYAKVTII